MLPDPTKLTVSTLDLPLTRKKLESLEHLVVVVPKKGRGIQWKAIPQAEALKKLERRNRAPGAIPSAQTRLGNKAQTLISLVRVDSSSSTFELQTQARKALAHVLGFNPASLALLVSGYDDDRTNAVAGAFTIAAMAAITTMPSAKSKQPKAARLKRLHLVGAGEIDIERLRAEQRGNQLARWLTSLPPNQLDAAGYRKRVEALAKQQGWDMKFLNRSALQKRGAGAFLAVARADENAGIVHLRYRPGDKKAAPDLALVGKGICFDTGGTNVKPAQYMLNMHDDMQGSAVALGTLLALSELGSDMAVDCWLAITENLISRDSYKQNEIVTALNGTTIEIMHTDAEGRMVLADTLSLAAAEQPAVMIDYATLTGSCVSALTTRYSGAFTNRDDLNPLLIDAGNASGERVWPFPMDDDFEESLRSNIADTLQCRIDGGGDHILAARFLQKFCDDKPWIHFDLSAGRNKGGLGAIPTDVSGFGVRMTLNLLLEQGLLEKVSQT
ncbi:MAG: leucyl aminopeptidase family protein [Gammaproteobacteria bacterium]|nr:leucyl aminopeptidase family protein [Gammaproteobacteria bacterium]